MPSLHARKLSVILFLCLCLLLLLPSLFFSLFLLSLSSFFLFFPIACILSSLYLLSAVLIRVPSLPLARSYPYKDDRRSQDCVGGNEQDCVELNSSEVPRLDESSEEEEEEEEAEEEKKSVGLFVKGEETKEDSEGFQEQFVMERGGYKSFYEILSFWRSKERKHWNRTESLA